MTVHHHSSLCFRSAADRISARGYEPRTSTARFEDGWIEMMIDSKLIVDPEVLSRNIDVDVVEGVVTLSGIVETTIARSEAEELAGSVDGVVRVVNDLTVDG